MKSDYKGRFAPTPSGPAHLGTLLAAVGSYLQAHANQGEWHVRIDDADPPREVKGAADSILRTLENFGLTWDGPVVYQSQRLEAYQDALQQLIQQGDTFECSCSRKDIRAIAQTGPNGMIYPGTCRNSIHDLEKPRAVRLQSRDTLIIVKDKIQGDYSLNMEQDVGDFIIRRADGLFAYHLATVVDDALDGFTEIVRGKDQLSLTPLHIYLQQQLGVTTPDYAHLPLLTNKQGEKLGKSAKAAAIDTLPPQDVWKTIFNALGLSPEDSLLSEIPSTILQWAAGEWDLLLVSAGDKIAE